MLSNIGYDRGVLGSAAAAAAAAAAPSRRVSIGVADILGCSRGERTPHATLAGISSRHPIARDLSAADRRLLSTPVDDAYDAWRASQLGDAIGGDSLIYGRKTGA
ncbi:hypothetical protein GGS24DRAFT_503051 [Hypoxylon argillaceum]|nr:hypothetical protein GGS24DRAFT_503051 [Hypoxylon argillaceum]